MSIDIAAARAGTARSGSVDTDPAAARSQGRLKILFAASEAYPLIKTGGLADVACYLPIALHEAGHDIRVVLPAYRSVLNQAAAFRAGKPQRQKVTNLSYRLLQGKLPGTDVPVYLVDIPELFDRRGDPYRDAAGRDWLDNAQRFAAFGRVIHALAMGRAGIRWQPQIVHCNDWHTGLAPALLALEPRRPATVFAIHNLAYQGDYSHDDFTSLQLPDRFWSPEALEFYGRFAFIKGGLVYADRLITVSPTYAAEITTAAFGFGMEGLLRHRRQVLSGILNGVDYRYWDPRHDPYIARHYWIDNLEDKLHNKHQLQQVLGLAVSDQIPLLAHISRLTWQKGIDFILEGLHELMHIDAVQLVVLGSGEAHYEQALRVAAQSFPDRLSVKLAYDESLAHRIQAGADMLLMPSRYEPCGLTQMYSMRYGTIPVVHRCGGLADTIVDTSPATLQSQTATGFCFDHTTTGEFLRSTRESIAAYRSGLHWRQIMHTAMHKDYSWSLSAQKYVAAYYEIIEEKQGVSDQGRSGDRV